MNEGQKQEGMCIEAVRMLAVDAIEKARSGHPGMPLGAATMACILWTRHLKHNPANPHWIDRDRFVLSAGHASALLYALLHLCGYELSLADLQSFRQWGSRTPGHPEYGRTPGVEMTTGPLGQGFAAAVGMAAAEAHLAVRFNQPNYTIIDHCTYVLASDGDLMEGVAAEACSLAGHLGLGKLIVLYDDNRVSLAGATALTFSEDVTARFAACGWHTCLLEDGEDLTAIDTALRLARQEASCPSLIQVRTVIGRGAPGKEGTAACHGSPLGPATVAALKQAVGWPLSPAFFVPDEVRPHFAAVAEAGRRAEERWQEQFRQYRNRWPELAVELTRRMAGELPVGWERTLPRPPAATAVATRKSSESVLAALAPVIPELMGGAADLNPSCFTWMKGYGDFERPTSSVSVAGACGGEWGYGGRNIHFGVREHAMGAFASGMVLHGGIIPFTGTFATFADYMRPPMRLAALMGLRVIYIFTHDSIGVGEDGPTHQPVEQLMNLRAVPNLTVIRPADAAETVEAWRAALGRREGPTALFLSRQDLPTLDRTVLAPAEGLQRGGYILWHALPRHDGPEVILIGTGSELFLALAAGRTLAEEGIGVRVVSLPSWELFDAQPQEYRDMVFPPRVAARVAVEAGIRLGWEHYVGLQGRIVGMDSFGASAPAGELYERFGITADAVATAARALISTSMPSGGSTSNSTP